MIPARLRALWSSNFIICKSGYGVQSISAFVRLAELPEFGGEPGSCEGRQNIAQHAWHGLQGGSMHVEGFKCYPGMDDPYGNDVIGRHTKDFGANIVITLIDAWVLRDTAKSIAPALYLPWFPVDHSPIPQRVLDGITGAHMPLSYSKWGRDMLNDIGVTNTYIPHGVEPSIYRVLPRDQVRQFKAQILKFDNGHLSLMVAANKGTPDRKWFQGQLRAWAEFAKDKPEARLYLHTDPTTVHGGIDFPAMTAQLGIADRVLFPDRYEYRMGYPPEQMAWLFNAADVYMGAAMSEGFGIPLIEAQSCGTPVVTTNFSAMPELVRWGYAVDVADMVWTPMNSYQAWPDVHDMTDKLNRLYDAWEVCGGDWPIGKRQATSKLIHDEYGWGVVVKDYWAPLMTKLADEAPPLDARFQAAGVEMVTERSVEIPWLVANLGTPRHILDIGSADATYVDALLATGAEVTLCDTRKIDQKNAVVWQWIGSAAQMPADWTGMFDLVTCISVLDHIGLDAYGNAADDTLLARTVAELARVTAPGGRLLLTVPFGRDHVTTHPGGGQRVFDFGALWKLFDADAWHFGDVSCWRLENNQYEPVPMKDIADAEYGGWRANAVIALELVRVDERLEIEPMEISDIEGKILATVNGNGRAVPAVPRRRVAPLAQPSKIVSYTSEELDKLPDESDWEANAAMTDEEIEAAIASDPDAVEIMDALSNGKAQVTP